MNVTKSLFTREVNPTALAFSTRRRRCIEIILKRVYNSETLFDHAYIPILYIKLIESIKEDSILHHVENIISILDGELISIIFICKHLCKITNDNEMSYLVEEIIQSSL